MGDIPISVQQAVRVALVFVALMVGFGILSNLTGWPDKSWWGIVVVVALGLAALPLLGPLLEFLRDSGAVIEIKGVKLDFSKSVMRGSRIERANFQDNPGVAVNDSDAASIAVAAEAAKSAAFVVVDLGSARSWYPTRLFVLAAAAEELQGARAVVILAQRGGVSGCFMGWLSPKDMVAAFCQSDDRYRLALSHARTVLWNLRLSGGYDTYPFPAQYQLDAQRTRRAYLETGDLAFVPALISRLQSPPANPDNAAPPTVSDALENVSEPKWLSREEAGRLFDPWMIRDHMRDGLSEAEKWTMLCRAGQADQEFLAVTEDDGSFRGMIDVAATVRSVVLCPKNVKA
jgi:hypothetical protein